MKEIDNALIALLKPQHIRNALTELIKRFLPNYPRFARK